MITPNLAPNTARTYIRGDYSRASVCGSTLQSQFYIHDRSTWETFEPSDLAEYLAEGTEKAVSHLERIAYLDYPYTEQDELNLRFMVEALLQARHVADEVGLAR